LPYTTLVAELNPTHVFSFMFSDFGSDAGNLALTAKLDGDHYILNGSKVGNS